jgi:T5orf172 domain
MTLYLLVDSGHDRFKIGVATDWMRRYLSLKNAWGEFDLAQSCLVAGEASEIRRLERTLHFLFDRWRVEGLEELDGYTEWFKMECYGQVREMIEGIDHLRSHSKLAVTVGLEGQIKRVQIKHKESISPCRDDRWTTERIAAANWRKWEKFRRLMEELKASLIAFDTSSLPERWTLLFLGDAATKDALAELFRFSRFDSSDPRGGARVISFVIQEKEEGPFLAPVSLEAIKSLSEFQDTKEIGVAVANLFDEIWVEWQVTAAHL